MTKRTIGDPGEDEIVHSTIYTLKIISGEVLIILFYDNGCKDRAPAGQALTN